MHLSWEDEDATKQCDEKATRQKNGWPFCDRHYKLYVKLIKRESVAQSLEDE